MVSVLLSEVVVVELDVGFAVGVYGDGYVVGVDLVVMSGTQKRQDWSGRWGLRVTSVGCDGRGSRRGFIAVRVDAATIAQDERAVRICSGMILVLRPISSGLPAGDIRMRCTLASQDSSSAPGH